MYKICALTILAVLAFAAGCQSKSSRAQVFHCWGWENMADARLHLDAYKHVLVARIEKSHWEDRGPHKLTPYHFEGTVVRTYKGTWRVAEKIAFVHYVDAPALTNTSNSDGSELFYIFTNEYTNSEIVLDTGEFGTYDNEHEPALERIYPRVRR